MADFDNDGYLDIYVNNGGLSDVLVNDVLTSMPIFVQFYIAWEPAYNTLYRNNGDLTFADVTDRIRGLKGMVSAAASAPPILMKTVFPTCS